MAVESWFYMSMANFLVDFASRQSNAYITIVGGIKDECSSSLKMQDVHKMTSVLAKNISTRWLRGPYAPLNVNSKSEVRKENRLKTFCSQNVEHFYSANISSLIMQLFG